MLSKKAHKISPSITLAINSKIKELIAKGEDVVAMGAGEPNFPTPDHICNAAIQAIQSGKHGYTPAAGLNELRKSIANWCKTHLNLSYNPEEILVSSGAKHAIFNTLLCLLNPGDEVLLPIPYWVSYPEQIRLCGGVPKYIPTLPENGFKLSPQQLKNAITPKTKLLILNTPCNPTGSVYTQKELEDLIPLLLKYNLFLLSDEIYSHFVFGNHQHISPLALHPQLKQQAILIHGVSKLWAMTGWRIGFAAGPKEIISAATRIQSHTTSNPCTISQYAAIEALKNGQKDVENMRTELEKRRNYLYEKLLSIENIHPIEPHGAFYCFVDVSAHYGKKWGLQTIENSLDFSQNFLEAKKVGTVPGKAFGLDTHIRLSSATTLGNIKRATSRLEAFLNELH